MDPSICAQGMLQCNICESRDPPLYCDICHKQLCKVCVGDHILDETTEHKVVPLQKRGSATKCQKHSSKICELYCEQCYIPICVQCISSGEHRGHEIVEIVERLESLKEIILKDLQELEKSIYPKYQEIASIIPVRKADLTENSKKMTTAIEKHGEDLHREIDSMIKKLKSNLEEIELTHLKLLQNHENKITRIKYEIEESIADLKKLLCSTEISIVSAYKSKNAEFKILPPKLTVTLPSFSPQKITKELIYQQFGSLSELSIKTEDDSFTLDSPSAESPSQDRLFIDVPRIIMDINTEYEGSNNALYCLSCLSDEDIWTSGNNKMIQLYNSRGELVKSIQTMTRNSPIDIAVIGSGDLVYCDYNDKSVNIINDTQVDTLIRPWGFRPVGVCSTSNGDILVIMINHNYRSSDKSKVVRYSGHIEKQTIKYDDKGRFLYPFGSSKYITENKNLDICVADNEACAVVVVNQAGKLRFRYTGPSSINDGSLKSFGIATDSQSRILTADRDNNRIHILDQDGQFLRFIENCHLQAPCYLCIDSKDNLFVAELITGKVKKIQYYK
nr:E3 ubiquitin-protein ligase TRIM71-like [Crassostrea gigas]